jgi:D-methionine transport system substrate-binding protein
VFKGEIDADVMQHTVFLNSDNERQKTDLVREMSLDSPPKAAVRARSVAA